MFTFDTFKWVVALPLFWVTVVLPCVAFVTRGSKVAHVIRAAHRERSDMVDSGR